MTANRREFLKTSLASAGVVTWGLSMPTFLKRTAAAAPLSDKPGAKDTILVVVELNGGNDGLNTVIPFKDPEYAKLRPTLKQPESQIKKLNDELGLHPQLNGIADLYNEGVVSVVQGVGYPNPNQSHFESMDIWQAATTDKTRTEGWIGKAYQPKAAYPLQFPLANRLRLAAQLIDAGVGARIFYVSLGGFDTHSGQAQAHLLLMLQLSLSLTAFYKDMAARGHKDRLLI